jgi:hypothetical protein
MEGRGEATALTPVLLDALKIHDADGRMQGRPMPLRQFIDGIYALRPIELARFAPLVVAHRADPVAARLIAEAERYLIGDFALAYDPSSPGPVVLGGGVIAHLAGVPVGIAEIVRSAGREPDIRLAGDGSVGAIVLALRAVGIRVDEPMFQRIAASVAERTARPVVA